jgi:hypothetical protein
MRSIEPSKVMPSVAVVEACGYAREQLMDLIFKTKNSQHIGYHLEYCKLIDPALLAATGRWG